MSGVLWVSILAGALALSVPLIIAGIGEGFVERAGRLNLGIEGMMILGAFTGVFVGSLAGPLAGLAAAIATGVLVAAVMNVLVYRLRANEIVVGLAITMLGLGLSSYLFQLWVPAGTGNVSVATFGTVPFGPLADIPVIGPVVFEQGPLFFASLALLAVAWFLVRSTRFGLRIRAVGADPAAAALRGVRVREVGALSLLIGGATAGAAGAVITLSTLGSFTPNVTAGRGYIVLAIVIMGRTHPFWIALGALLFAFLQSFSLLAQGGQLGLPSELFHTLPYLVTLVVLVLSSRGALRRLTRTESR